MHGKLLLGVILALGLVQAAARGETLRLPDKGDPAFTVDVPDGWIALDDLQGTLRLGAKDRSCVLHLSIMSGPGSGLKLLTGVAALYLEHKGFQSYSSTRSGWLDGRPAEVFFATTGERSGGVLNIMLTLAKLDSEHIASMARVTTGQANPGQLAAADELISRVRLVGLKE